MKRIGIFQIFNEHGFIEEYVEFLLKSMHPILSKLVIVCNCNIEKMNLRNCTNFQTTFIYERTLVLMLAHIKMCF